MTELERIEDHLERGLVREYVLRRCSKLTLEELCHRRNVIVLPTGKRSANRTVKSDYIRTLLEYTRGKGATTRDHRPILARTDLGINVNDVEVEMSGGEAKRDNLEGEANNAEAVASDMEMEVDGENDTEVNSGGKDGNAEVVRIRIFRGAKDWEPIDEMELRLESCGGLNLALLQEKLGGQIQVISPRTYRPFYEYTKGFLDGEDVQELLQDRYLRVVTQK